MAVLPHKRAHDFARALPPALARDVDGAKNPAAKLRADSSRAVFLHSPPHHAGSFSRPIESADNPPTLVFVSPAQSHPHPIAASPRHHRSFHRRTRRRITAFTFLSIVIG